MTLHDDPPANDLTANVHAHLLEPNFSTSVLECPCGFTIVGEGVRRLFDAVADGRPRSRSDAPFQASVIEQLAEMSAKLDKLSPAKLLDHVDDTVVRCESCGVITAKASALRSQDDDVYECPACAPARAPEKAAPFTFDMLTDAMILALAEAHITHFLAMQRQGEAGDRSVRLGEVREYLTIWYSVRAIGGSKLGLNHQARGEIMDALDSGEFDTLLQAAKDAGPLERALIEIPWSRE